jgi:hypothetical protein
MFCIYFYLNEGYAQRDAELLENIHEENCTLI